jgi:hypothetical protein
MPSPPPPQWQWSCMTCRSNKLGPKIYYPHLRPRNPLATRKYRVRRSSPVGSPHHNPHGREARRSGPAPLQVAIAPSPNLPFSLAATEDPGRGSDGAARPDWKGLARAGHRRGWGHWREGPQDKRWPWGLGGGGPRGARVAAGVDKEQRGPRRPRLPRASSQNGQPWARGSGSPGQPVGLWPLSFAQRPSSPALPGGAGRGREARVCSGHSPRCGQARGGGDGRGGGGAAGTRVAAAGEGAAPGALRRCGGGGHFPKPGRGASRAHRRRRRSEADDALSAPAAPVPPALSLRRPKVTSGASVSR